MLLKDLSNEKLFEVVSKNETLIRSFDDYVWDSELDHISEKLDVVRASLSTWEVGLCNYNFMRVKDYEAFVYYARDCEKIYGLSDKCGKYLAQCEKLRGTNLFEYHAKQFAEMWFKEEIQDAVKWVEDFQYNVYCGKRDENTDYFLEMWAEYDDHIFDEETEEVWEPAKKVY